MSKARSYTAALVVAVIVCVLAGSTPAATQPAGTIVVAQGVDATTMDPTKTFEIPTQNVHLQVFDSLLLLDAQGRLRPALAVSWRPVGDKTWELKLREGVKFHNGEPFNAHAVKFTIERALDAKSVQRQNFIMISSVEVVDSYTVRLHTEKPSPLVPAALTRLGMMPPRYIEEKGQDYFAKDPVGTGPFKFVKWVKDDRVVLEANTDYWGGAPKVQNLIFRAIPEAFTRIAELKTGGADVITNVTPHQVADINASGVARVAPIKSARYIFIGFNLNIDSPLRDVRVRQALNYAVDKEAIISAVLMGYGQPLATVTHEFHFGHNPEVKPYPYDPSKAKALLAEAGFPKGFSINFQAPSGRYLQDKLVAEAVAGQLRKVGVNANLKIMEWGTYVATVMTARNPVEMYLLGWGNIPGMDAHNILFPLFRHGEAQPFCYYNDPEWIEIIDKAATNVDAEKREATYRDLVRRIHDSAPWIFLYQQQDLYGISNRVDWKPRPDEWLDMRDARVR